MDRRVLLIIKSINFVEDHPMNIHAKLSSNWPSAFRGEYLNLKVDGR